MASSNWIALQKRLSSSISSAPRKRRKLDHHHNKDSSHSNDNHRSHQDIVTHIPKSTLHEHAISTSTPPAEVKKGESLVWLRNMVNGRVEYTDTHQLPGKYLCLDCEMVGVGIDGSESSLARISVVNFYGAILLDEFVRQKERVVDYRTQWSGVRPADMANAKSFEEVQKQVADLLKDRILVGHAVFNDLKALLLTHPRPYTRDTQHLAYKHKLVKTNRAALRNLVKDELGVQIQGGEHSSVTDARATMAIYRIHKKEWDKGFPKLPDTTKGKSKSTSSPRPDAQRQSSQKRRRNDDEDDGLDEADDDDGDRRKAKVGLKEGEMQLGTKAVTESVYDGGGRKGVSSGLSVVVKQLGRPKTKTSKPGMDTSKKTRLKPDAAKAEWWKQLK